MTPRVPNQQQDEKAPPPTTPIDRDCAFFVRDALFPLRRDWGSKRKIGRNHHQIHPALMALDRLRTDLIGLRPNSTSFSNIFPRGVILVSKSDALVGSSSNNSNHKRKAMEYNGQPDVDEASATVEVIPNLLTVKCMRCNNNKSPFLPVSRKAFVRGKHKPWKNPNDDDYESSKEHEIVVCSDRILQKDYYAKSSPEERNRREDLPIRSMGAVEETLAREITKIQVQPERSATGKGKPTAPISYPSFPSRESSCDVTASCEAFARLELLAARAAECLLVSKEQHDDDTNRITETRMGSALFPKPLVSILPTSLQRNFVDRCTLKVATQHTMEAANEAGSELLIRPRDCVQKAWDAGAQNNKNGSQ